jgi:hypothetical protein
MHELFVFNILAPYMKNLGIWAEPNGSQVDVPGGATFVGVPPQSVKEVTNYTYNGLLHGYEGNGITSPANLAVWWNGSGKANFRGIGQANPDLMCNNWTLPCKYIPMRSGCGPSVNGEWSVTYGISQGTGWDVHTRGQNWSFADSHVKWRRNGVYGTYTTNRTDPRTDAFSRYNGQFTAGVWYDQWFCHSYLFRPEFDFANWDPATEG